MNCFRVMTKLTVMKRFLYINSIGCVRHGHDAVGNTAPPPGWLGQNRQAGTNFSTTQISNITAMNILPQRQPP